MTRIVSVAQMKAIEAAADRAGLSYARMMENAGLAVARAVLRRIERPTGQPAVVLCGSGNNGGDGLVAAYHLAQAGLQVTVYLARRPDPADANLQRVRQTGLPEISAEDDPGWDRLRSLIGGASVLIDAVFGTGARLPLSGRARELLEQVGAALKTRTALPLRIAVDCPSGLDCDTGALDPVALPADVTVTFAAAKRGQLAFPGADALGQLEVAEIGIDPALPELVEVPLTLATPEAVRQLLPARPRSAHKGTFGRAIVAAGSVNYTGAAYLAGAAAYRVGAGLVTLAVPAPLHPILAGQLPEATWLMLPVESGVIAGDADEILWPELARCQALLVGPGFGTEKTTGRFLRRLLGAESGSPLGFGARAALEGASARPGLPPMVVDADGLRLLAGIEDWSRWLPPHSVLTPHPGEMAALTGLGRDQIQADRLETAQRSAAQWGHVVVLKGAFSVVAAPDGRAVVQPFATAALARAGTGDVLAGAIAGLLAQGLSPYDAAVAGAYLHGQAGVMAAQALGTTASVLASDVLRALPEALAGV